MPGMNIHSYQYALKNSLFSQALKDPCRTHFDPQSFELDRSVVFFGGVHNLWTLCFGTPSLAHVSWSFRLGSVSYAAYAILESKFERLHPLQVNQHVSQTYVLPFTSQCICSNIPDCLYVPWSKD